MLRRNPRSPIGDSDLHRWTPGRRTGFGRSRFEQLHVEADRRPRAAVFDRIVEQVHEQLVQLIRIAHDLGQDRRCVVGDLDLLLLGDPPHPLQDLIQHRT